MDEATFAKRISESSQIIGFQPMSDEPAYVGFLKELGVTVPEEIIPADATLSPEETAKKFAEQYGGSAVSLFIPGQKFDKFGTRHGRGHGWYDRFLSQLPREWLRVGVLDVSRLSDEKLKRQTWDQPVDMLLVSEKGGWRIISV
jgi:hypothetical protein